MPSQLISAKIRGVRSYSPREDKLQFIDFMPLTLIVGKNGTGKTTIIEALKFIIAGEEPPHSDSRRNFIHTQKDGVKKSKISNEHNYASVEIEFRNNLGQTCLARREISLAGTAGKNSTPAISSGYKIDRSSWVPVHRQDDWCKVMPKLFGLPNQAILSHVILCHQEDNLWCMSESANVKLIFDKIFGCEKYKKEIKHIEEEIKACKKEVLLGEKDLVHQSQIVERKQQVSIEIENLDRELKKCEVKANHLDKEIELLIEEKKTINDKLKEGEASSRQISSLKQRIRELSERDNVLRKSLQPWLNKPKSASERRPPPPPPARKAKKKNKPEQDPTAVELAHIESKICRTFDIIAKLPESDDTKRLQELLDEIKLDLERVKRKFEVMLEEESEEDEVDHEELQRKWYEEQEAAEARRVEEENKIRCSIESSIEKNSAQLEEAKSKLEKLDSETRSFFGRLEETQKELKDVEQKLVNVRHNRSMIDGSKMQMEREIRKLQAEFRNYWRANINYSETLGRLVCNNVIQNDLEKLKTCFNESISSFHDQMICKINEALRSRWRQIYQGGDIDAIEVVAEETARGKLKSYNYYMAMRRGGTRMKMREKSSAGQRALASIILRMTLAELFVRDFTFIALDEPTANLDLSNVQALAKSIGSYVRRRTKKGANIQWIIITHDEEFLKALDEESSPFFYRVGMNNEGFSEITKISSLDSGFEAKFCAETEAP